MTPREPLPLEPLRPGGSGRAAKLGAVAAVFGGVAVLAVGLFGPDAPGSRPTASGAVSASGALSASQRPSSAPSSSPAPHPSPLPTLELGAADAGLGRIVVGTPSGLGAMDRGNGLLDPIDIEGEGYLVPAGSEGWLCVCTLAPWSSEVERRTVRLVPVSVTGVAGRPVLERELVAARRAPDDHDVLSAHATVTRDGATAALGWIARQADGSWRLEIELVPLRPDGFAGHAVVADLPADPPIVSADGPLLEFDPSGAALLAGLRTSRESGVDELFAAPRWLVPLDRGAIGDARPLEGTVAEAAAAEAWPLCGAEGWAAAGLAAAVCGDTLGRWQLRRWDAAGTRLEPIALGPTFEVPGIAFRFDAPNGRVIGWDPYGHRLTSVDAFDGQVRVAPPGGGPPDYPGSGTSVYPTALFGSAGAIAVSSSGDRVYALGEALVGGADQGDTEEAAFRSTGIWVVDLATMRIIDRWPATARFHQVVASRAGTEILAAGLSGVDAGGHDSPEQGPSITVFDSATGDVRLVAGQLDADGWVFFP